MDKFQFYFLIGTFVYCGIVAFPIWYWNVRRFSYFQKLRSDDKAYYDALMQAISIFNISKIREQFEQIPRTTEDYEKDKEEHEKFVKLTYRALKLTVSFFLVFSLNFVVFFVRDIFKI